jgi:hypothetical protein
VLRVRSQDQGESSQAQRFKHLAVNQEVLSSITFGEPNIFHFEILSGLLVNDAVIFIGKTGHTAVKAASLRHGNIAADVLRLGSAQPFQGETLSVSVGRARLVNGVPRQRFEVPVAGHRGVACGMIYAVWESLVIQYRVMGKPYPTPTPGSTPRADTNLATFTRRNFQYHHAATAGGPKKRPTGEATYRKRQRSQSPR